MDFRFWAIQNLSLNPGKSCFPHDEQIFSDHLKNSPEKVELITNFHKNYKLKNIKSNTALLRIDYVIEDATFNSENIQLRRFSMEFNYTEG
jgi:hypothetical protein